MLASCNLTDFKRYDQTQLKLNRYSPVKTQSTTQSRRRKVCLSWSVVGSTPTAPTKTL
jgi:hypothetical protein